MQVFFQKFKILPTSRRGVEVLVDDIKWSTTFLCLFVVTNRKADSRHMQEVTVRLYYRVIECSVRETQAARDELLNRKGVEKEEGENELKMSK